MSILKRHIVHVTLCVLIINFAILYFMDKPILRMSPNAEYAETNNSGTTKAPQVSRRYLGLTILALTPNILMELRMMNPEIPSDIEHGIFVWRVIIGSPAYNGGTKPSDIVVCINSTPVRTASDIYTLLENTTGNLLVEIVRGRQRLTLTITPENH